MRVKNMTISYGKKVIIDNFSYDFTNEYIYNVYGSNGAGKSTFAKVLAGYLPYGGKSEFAHARIGMVSSCTGVPNEISVKDAVHFLDRHSDMTLEYRERLFELCNIEKIMDRKKIRMLSDGERKKLLIYSVMNCEKDVLILDEFMSNLDRKSSEDMRKFIIELHKELHFVCINITHALEDARKIQGKILYLDSEIKTFREISNVEELSLLM